MESARRVWDHVERRYVECESAWSGRGSVTSDDGWRQHPGVKPFGESDFDDEPEVKPGRQSWAGPGTRKFTPARAAALAAAREGAIRYHRAANAELYARILSEGAGLTVREAAKRCGCNERTVMRARRAGAQ